jgi:ATP-binding cassette, subfamily F, member 3
MSIVSIQGISKSFGGRRIFGPITWSIHAEARVGLVGANGAGKSTLLRMIAGLEQLDEGLIVRRKGLKTAYLRQEVVGDERSVLGSVLANRPDIAQLEARLEAIERRLADPEVVCDDDRLATLLDEQARALERWQESGGPQVHNRAVGFLRTLGIADEDFQAPTSILSGGQRKLVALAGCLLQEPDLLLLDVDPRFRGRGDHHLA